MSEAAPSAAAVLVLSIAWQPPAAGKAPCCSKRLRLALSRRLPLAAPAQQLLPSGGAGNSSSCCLLLEVEGLLRPAAHAGVGVAKVEAALGRRRRRSPKRVRVLGGIHTCKTPSRAGPPGRVGDAIRANSALVQYAQWHAHWDVECVATPPLAPTQVLRLQEPQSTHAGRPCHEP